MGFVDGATGKRRLLPVVAAEEGANATLECRAGGIPLPNITWVSQSVDYLEHLKSKSVGGCYQRDDCLGAFLPELVYRVTILVGKKFPLTYFWHFWQLVGR